MRRTFAHDARDGEAGFGLLEMIIVLAILGVLAAILVLTMGSTKEASRDKISMSRMQEAKTALQRARDREQMTLREIVGAGSYGACRSVNPLPRVAQLGGGCRAAWDAVNARLVPYVGNAETTARMMTDGSGRPVLVNAQEVGCPGAPLDELVTVSATGDWSKPSQKLQLTASGYGC